MRVGAACLAAAALVFGAAAARAAPPLVTGIAPIDPADPTLATRLQAAGATVERLSLSWNDVAPVKAPTGFDPKDPGDTAYRWGAFDAEVQAAASAGVAVIADVVAAPTWARLPGSTAPTATALQAFAHAAAARYSGRFEGLPRVRDWEVWNEPNLSPDLSPQLVDGKPASPGEYRAMVNAVAAGVKSVHGDNLVIAGALAPFRDITPAVLKQDSDWGPLSFMRDLLCLSASLEPTCSTPARFDVWSTHPYTSGGPTHHAALANDVSLADLPKMRRVLQAAVRAGHIESRGPVKFWVTEFSWDSDPPDPKGVPTALLDRWVPQALYVMWRSGVSLVTWFSVEDQPLRTSLYQSGLYYLSGKPKPYREGFRFPLVAFPRGGGVYVWGRTPFGLGGRVAIERDVGGRRIPLGTVTAGATGIFQHTFRTGSSGSIRGRLLSSGEWTLPFSLTPVPDRFFNPFGGTTLLEPKRR